MQDMRENGPRGRRVQVHRHIGIHAFHHFRDGHRTRFQALADLVHPLLSMGDQRLDKRACFGDRGAVGRPVSMIIERKQFFEALHILAHIAVGRGDHRR